MSKKLTFSEFVYKRPDLAAYGAFLAETAEQIRAAKSAAEVIALNKAVIENNEVDSMATLCSIRNSLNTKDAFYEAERAYFDEETPHLQVHYNALAKALVESPFRKELVAEFGQYYFDKLELEILSFDKKMVPFLVEENKLVTKFSKLKGTAQIEFAGKQNNLSQMGYYRQDQDRAVRKAASLAVSGWFAEHEAEIDEIYDALVHNRTEMARALGFATFTPLGYKLLMRTDYTEKEVAAYREQIKKVVVPLCVDIRSSQKARLGIADFKHYDWPLTFPDGNAKPLGGKAELVAAAQAMYSEMHPQIGKFFEFMRSAELLDLETRDGKDVGGYCTFISKYKAPFIFSNFNGTQGDVDVLTHEAGHAFMAYECRDFKVASNIWPTLEACEIHSMSMEFFAWPWMEKFFGAAAQKYRYAHLAGALTFLPYGCLVDEFQHEVYANPDLSGSERRALWRRLEKEYLPDKDYAGDAFLEAGGFWFQQSHIFSAPFYYIDYTLAQVCAFQYLLKSQANFKQALAEYIALCRLGGTQSFLGLLKTAGLVNPFKPGALAPIIAGVANILATEAKKLREQN